LNRDADHRTPLLTSVQDGRAWQYDLVAAVPELRGNRIVLNAHADQDAVAHVAGEDEETARRFGWWPKHSTEETVRAAYADWARNWHDDGPRRTFADRDPESGALVGGCELRIRPNGTGEVSYWTHAGQRGRRHARNALSLLACYAASIGVTCLEAHIAPDNHASRRVAEATGFTQAGIVMDDGTEMIRYIRRTSDNRTGQARWRTRRLQGLPRPEGHRLARRRRGPLPARALPPRRVPAGHHLPGDPA
jgi:RimJ/RimL family protein N-acetyltransferase